jgi:hypothetical protein
MKTLWQKSLHETRILNVIQQILALRREQFNLSTNYFILFSIYFYNLYIYFIVFIIITIFIRFFLLLLPRHIDMLFWDQSLQDKFCIILYKYTYPKNLMVIGTCCTGSCKSNYHTNTTSPQTRYMILQSTLKLRCSIMWHVW